MSSCGAVAGASSKHTWSPEYEEWIKSLRLGSETQELAKLQYLGEVEHFEERIEVLTEHVERLASALDGLHGKLYRSYQALRGTSTSVAATLVSELGHLRRFKTAGALMGYVGMVPREHSSGPKVWRGSITESGNPRVRRVLVAAVRSRRLRPAKPARLVRRQAGLSLDPLGTPHRGEGAERIQGGGLGLKCFEPKPRERLVT